MRGLLLLLGFYFLAVNATHAQVKTGTIVIFQLTDDKFVVAADSRAMIGNNPPDDTNCKISAFKMHRTVFAASGPVSYPKSSPADPTPSWNAVSEARRAVGRRANKRIDAAREVQLIASNWADNMLVNWRLTHLHHPDYVAGLAKKNNGQLTKAVFAIGRAGEIAFAYRSIIFVDDGPTVDPAALPDCHVAPFALGKSDIYVEYVVTKQTERAKKETWKAPATLKKMSPEMFKAIRIADLTIAYEPSGTVGGKVDAAELWKDGSVHWIQKKCNCPDSSD